MAVRLVVRPPGGRADYSLTFDQQKIAIGRGATADLRLPHRCVSETHALIRLEGQDYVLVDPGSTNGTTLNGAPLVHARPRLLRSGDTIGIVGFEVSFRAGAAMEGAHTAERTAALARRIVREAIEALGAGGTPPRLTISNGPQVGRRIELGAVPSVIVIGRADTCDVVLDDADASRRHCEVRRDLEGVVLCDLGAKNPTLVGDEPAGERVLRDRDEILVGATRLVFEDPAEAYLAELQNLERDAPMPAAEPVPVDIPETRVHPVDEPLRPAAERIPPPVAARVDASESASGGSSVGDWVVVALGLLVLAGSVVAIFYVFR